MSTKCVRNKSMRLRLKPKDHVKTYSQLFHRPAPTVGCWLLSQGWTCYYRSHSTSIIHTLQQVLREGTQFLFLGKPRWNPDTIAHSSLSYTVMISHWFVRLTHASVPLLIYGLYEGQDYFQVVHYPVEYRHKCSEIPQSFKPPLR